MTEESIRSIVAILTGPLDALKPALRAWLDTWYGPYRATDGKCRAKDPAHCRVHGTPREVETKPSYDRFGSTDENTLVSKPRENIKRGNKALESILRKRSGFVDKAMYREETGWIGFDWGWEGNPNPDKRGVTYKGGHGISHMLSKHPGDIDELPNVIAHGEAHSHPTDKTKTYFVHGYHVAVVTYFTQKRKRALTEFEIADPRELKEITKYPSAKRHEGLKGG